MMNLVALVEAAFELWLCLAVFVAAVAQVETNGFRAVQTLVSCADERVHSAAITPHAAEALT